MLESPRENSVSALALPMRHKGGTHQDPQGHSAATTTWETLTIMSGLTWHTAIRSAPGLQSDLTSLGAFASIPRATPPF
jgi:hypothetical protein